MRYKKYFRKTSLKQKGHGEFFLNEVLKKKPKTFLEIGVFHGVTARNICELLSQIHKKEFKPYISHKTGFGLTLLEGNNAHIHSYTSSKSEVYLCLEGEWEITCNDKKVLIGPRDAFSPPKNSTRSLKNISSDKGSIYIVRQKN